MLEYARSDTHFLLFIYDNLRNALLDRATSRSRSSSPPSSANPTTAPSSSSNSAQLSVPPPTATVSTSPAHALINHVLARSAETCLRVYAKEPYDHISGSGSNGWDTLAKKWNKPFFTASSSPSPGNNILAMQKAVYRAVHWWREKVAREEDESTRYVLPNQFLFRIAEAPPGDLAALLRLFGSSVPAVVKRRAKELLDAVRDAVKSSLGGGEGEVRAEKVESMKEKADTGVEVREEQAQVEQNPKESTEKLWGTSRLLPSVSVFADSAQVRIKRMKCSKRLHRYLASLKHGHHQLSQLMPQHEARFLATLPTLVQHQRRNRRHRIRSDSKNLLRGSTARW